MTGFKHSAIDFLFGFLAAVGVIGICFIVGLWSSGFFHSIAKHHPEFAFLNWITSL